MGLIDIGLMSQPLLCTQVPTQRHQEDEGHDMAREPQQSQLGGGPDLGNFGLDEKDKFEQERLLA